MTYSPDRQDTSASEIRTNFAKGCIEPAATSKFLEQ